MKNIKNNLLLSKVKNNALKLRATYQLPYYLVYLITKLDQSDEVEYVQFLMASCEHSMRSKGYYKKYPEVEKSIEEELKKSIDNRTYLNI